VHLSGASATARLSLLAQVGTNGKIVRVVVKCQAGARRTAATAAPLIVLAVTALLPCAARADLGDLGFVLEPGYAWRGGDEPWSHAVSAGGAIDLGLTRISALRLSTRYLLSPPSGERAVDASLSHGIAGTIGAVLLVDTLPSLRPWLSAEAALGYAGARSHVDTSGEEAATPTALQAGGVFGVGLEAEVADPIWIGGALRYWMLAPLGAALVSTVAPGELNVLVTLSLRLRTLGGQREGRR